MQFHLNCCRLRCPLDHSPIVQSLEHSQTFFVIIHQTDSQFCLWCVIDSLCNREIIRPSNWDVLPRNLMMVLIFRFSSKWNSWLDFRTSYLTTVFHPLWTRSMPCMRNCSCLDKPFCLQTDCQLHFSVSKRLLLCFASRLHAPLCLAMQTRHKEKRTIGYNPILILWQPLTKHASSVLQRLRSFVTSE